MNNLSFPFKYRFLPEYGRIFYPSIKIKLNTIDGIVKYDFIVDTGSDLTTLPNHMAEKLNLDLSLAKSSKVEGIGGYEVKIWQVKIKLIFDEEVISVRANITDENKTPFLLGRLDFLDVLYSWNFNAKKKTIEFEKL